METMAQQYAEKLAEENPYTEQIQSLKETGMQEIDFEHINELTELREHQDFLYKLLTSKDRISFSRSVSTMSKLSCSSFFLLKRLWVISEQI